MKKAGKTSNEELPDAYSKLSAVNYNKCREIVNYLITELINRDFNDIEITHSNAGYVASNYDKLYLLNGMRTSNSIMVKYHYGYFLIMIYIGKLYLLHYAVSGIHSLIATACAPLYRDQFLTKITVRNDKELLNLVSKV
jgi:hypothetical protein